MDSSKGNKYCRDSSSSDQTNKRIQNLWCWYFEDLEDIWIEEEIHDVFENIATAKVANRGYYEERLEDIDEEEHYYYSSEDLKDELRR